MKAFFCFLILSYSCYLQAQGRFSNAGKLALSLPGDSSLLCIQNGSLHVLVKTHGNTCDSVLGEMGININSRFGQILSLQLPADKLSLLAEIPCISYIDPATKSNAARFKNDIERQVSSVDKVHNGLDNSLPMNYKGKGVIVGIVDIGFQCNHPTFYTSDGKHTRIVRYWQQNNTAGPAPAGFSYGTEISDTSKIVLNNDLDGTHGTHVAGIAAGSGYTTPSLQYAGMAPEAELVFVSIKYNNDTLGGSALGDYIVANPTILDAYNYIFSYAASVGKPAVINLSWGMHTGPHDGSSLFDLATESLTGKGRILVGSNGNEGDNPMHWYYAFNKDTASTLLIENGRQYRQRESVYCDFWGSKNSEFSIKIQFIDTLKQVMAETPFVSSATDGISNFNFMADSSVFKVSLVCEAQNPENQKPNITVMADHKNQRKYAIVARICSDSSEVHAWNSGAVKEWTSGSFANTLNQIHYENEFIAGNSDYTAGENGGTSKAVISVGALAARSAYRNVKGIWVNDSAYVTPVHITKFSSRGPTVDGRVKPNISAPGYDVPSSINNRQFPPWMSDKTVLKTVFQNDTQYWSVSSGTSMAAPHVTGIVALILQVKPDLDASQVKEILESTATEDANTSGVPNMQYGYGKVNAYAAIVKTLQIAGINILNRGNSLQVFPNPFDQTLEITLPQIYPDAFLEIINPEGQSLFQWDGKDLHTSKLELSTGFLSSGMYMLRFVNRGEIFVWKLLKS